MVFKNKQAQSGAKITKKLVLLCVIALLVILVALFYIITNREQTTSRTETQDDNTYHLDSRDELEDPQNAPSEIHADQDEAPARNPDYIPPAGGQVTITRVENTGNEIVVAALVQGVETGNCNVTYSNGTSQIKASAPIQQGPTYFACQVSIPRAQFTTTGTWNLLLEAGSASGKGEINL